MSTPPHPEDDGIDARFAEIVAGWDAPPSAAPGPGALPQSTDETVVRPLPPAPPEPRRPSFQVAPEGWRVHLPPEEMPEDDEFEQPDPPLPRGDVRYWGAVLGLALGPLLVMGWVFTGPHSTNLPILLGAIATVAGFGLLIAQLPDRHDEDDDGARV